ncbi:MAG TPA: hypothetical protein VLD58_15230, partial [Gemmatimonadales bacterium]|nr:hypothetical protein [Gemmatimonadales bacterium]
FGTETPLSVTEMVQHILIRMNRPELTPVILNQASHEIQRQYLDCTKARSMMGWRPRFTLEAALTETIAWYTQWLAARAGARAGPVGEVSA